MSIQKHFGNLRSVLNDTGQCSSIFADNVLYCVNNLYSLDKEYYQNAVEPYIQSSQRAMEIVQPHMVQNSDPKRIEKFRIFKTKASLYVRDLKPTKEQLDFLKSIDRLCSLSISGVLNNLESFSEFKNIENLELFDQVACLGGVEELSKLKSLKANYAEIQYIDELIDLPIEILYLEGNDIRDLRPLYELKSLKLLNVMGALNAPLDFERLRNVQLIYTEQFKVIFDEHKPFAWREALFNNKFV